MPGQFRLSVVAPDRSIVDEPVNSVVAPGSEGYFGVWIGHGPLIAALKPGILESLDANNQRHFVHVGGGFAEVTPTRVTILADEAARAQDIDLSRAEADLEQARRALRGEDATTSTHDAVLEVERAMNRVRAARLAGK